MAAPAMYRPARAVRIGPRATASGRPEAGDEDQRAQPGVPARRAAQQPRPTPAVTAIATASAMRATTSWRRRHSDRAADADERADRRRQGDRVVRVDDPLAEAEHGAGDERASRPTARARRGCGRCAGRASVSTSPATSRIERGRQQPRDLAAELGVEHARSSRSGPSGRRRARRRRRRCRSRCRSAGRSRCSRRSGSSTLLSCEPPMYGRGRRRASARRWRPTSRPTPAARRRRRSSWHDAPPQRRRRRRAGRRARTPGARARPAASW